MIESCKSTQAKIKELYRASKENVDTVKIENKQLKETLAAN